MKKIVKIILGIGIGILVIGKVIMTFIFNDDYVQNRKSNDKAKDSINSIIKKKYPGYTVNSLDLQYVGWFGTSIYSVSDNESMPHKAGYATVFIENETEIRTVDLKKKLFTWEITKDFLNGEGMIPEGEYYAQLWEEKWKPDEKDRMLKWISNMGPYFPFEDGSLYKEVVENGQSYFLSKRLHPIYRTRKGCIEEFDRNQDAPADSTWIFYDGHYEKYKELCENPNFTKVEKEYVDEIIGK